MPVKSIKIDDCIGCGTCVETCPMDVFRLDTLVEKKPSSSPCSFGCPLGLNQREYHNLIQLRMVDEASELLLKRHPMPSITGRICPHPCETECSRNQVDEAININGLEQYLGDNLLEQDFVSPVVKTGEKIAVIGSGPAGLSTAYHLAISGYDVTVFEKDEKIGGLLRYAIPSFRLSEEILDKQIDLYKTLGITFVTGVKIGKDKTKKQLEKEGFKAFAAATGASKPLSLKVPGSDAMGIVSAMAYLKDAKTGAIKKATSKVAIVGGGSVALDAARSAVRLGAEEVHVFCLEKLETGTKDSMLALPAEIEEAKEEGVIIHPSTAVKAFSVKDGNVSGISSMECLSVRDEDGKFNPAYGKDIDKDFKVDSVVLAIGQTADSELVPEEFKKSERGFIDADRQTLQVSSDLFAAGDAVTGPTTVVEALASGKRAALIIERSLKGEELTKGLNDEPALAQGPPEDRVIYTAKRENRCNVTAADRIKNFDETRHGLTDSQAMTEAERCLTCGSKSKIYYMDDCQVCRLCQYYCPTDAIEITDGAMMSSLHLFDVVKLGKVLRD
jgi:NADPH-dependent glutamate synthase beta subunit-like oxidoreductase